MANFTPPTNEFDTVLPQLNSSNSFSNAVFGNPIVIKGTRKINHTCLQLNGTTDYIVITKPILTKEIFTFDVWVWFTDISGSEQVIVSAGSGLTSTSLSVKNQKLNLINNTQEIAGTTTVTSEVWHHIALVRDGASAKAYLNGSLEISHEAFITPSKTPCQIGARLGANFLMGRLDAVRLRSEKSWTNAFTPPIRNDYIADEYFDDVVLLIRGDSFTNPIDPYADKLALQFGMDYYNNATYMGPWDNCDVTGSTTIGNAKIVSSHFKHNYAAISFDGINDAIVVENSTNIAFGTDFTLEFWAYFPNYTYKRTLFDKREASDTTGVLIYADTDTKLYVKFGDNTSGWEVEMASGTMSVGWHYFAIVRNSADSNSWKLFVDGSQSGTTINSAVTVADNSNLVIGRNRDNAEYFNGLLSEIQLTTTAKYTTSVTIPTAPVPTPVNVEYDQTSLLLHFDGADGEVNFTDSSRWNHTVSGSFGAKIATAQSKFGSSSLVLSGTAGCGVVVQPHESMNLGEGDFTIEAWVRVTAIGTARFFLSMWNQSMSGPWFALGMNASNRFMFYWLPLDPGSPVFTGSTVTIAANTWYHVAVTRRRDHWTLWVNGAIDATTGLNVRNWRFSYKNRPDRWKAFGVTLGDYFDTTNKYGSAAADWVGYIDEVRIVKGKAMFTEPFTPPTAAYSLSTNYPYRDSNVKLFLDPTSDYIIEDQSISYNEITLEGGISAGKAIGGSYATFDGTGDAFRSTLAGDVAFGTDDYTVESWIYPINGGRVSQNYGRIVETENYNTQGGFAMVMNNSGTSSPCQVLLHDTWYGGPGWGLHTNDTIPNSAWSHVAFTKSGRYLTSWVNGIPKSLAIFNGCMSRFDSHSSFTLSNFYKTVIAATSASWVSAFGSEYFNSQSSTGVYFEVHITTAVTSNNQIMGVVNASAVNTTYPGGNVNGWGYNGANGNKYQSATGTAYGSTYTTGDVISVAVKNGKIWFAKNGTWQASGNPVTEANPAFSNLVGLVRVAVGAYNPGTFVVRPNVYEFSYSIPSGFVPLQKVINGEIPFLDKTKVSIGADNTATPVWSFYGNIDDLRLTRGGVRYTIPWSEKTLAGDPNSSSVVLLLNCNGTDGGTTFTDSSNSAKTVNPTNTTTVTATKRFGSASALFNGTSSYLSLDDSPDWDFGSDPFTVEMWYKMNTLPESAWDGTNKRVLYNQRFDADNTIILVISKTGFTFQVRSSASDLVLLHTTWPHDYNWHHIAVTRSGNVFTIWVDGILLGTATAAITLPNLSAPFEIGRWSGGDYYFDGWLDDIRITKGVCRYPSEFNYPQPPTGLLPITRRKIRDLPSETTTPYAIRTMRPPASKFDIGADFVYPGIVTSGETNSRWVIMPYNLSMVTGQFDFTLEGWFYPTVARAGNWVFTKDINASDGFLISVSTSYIYFRGPSSIELTASVSLTGWNHIVFQKRENLKQIFLNGVKIQEISASTFDSSGVDDSIEIGAVSGVGAGSKYTGYIDGLRFTRGVARYLENFTPPTEQFPTKFRSFANTDLMLFFTDPPTPVSNTRLVGSPKLVRPSGVTEAGACWFDGNFDFIQLSGGSTIAYEDFTLEFWFEPHLTGSVSKPIYIWTQGGSLTQTDRVGLALVGPNLKWFFGTTFTSLGLVSLYDWTHVAITRQSGWVRFFIDGSLVNEGSIPYFGAGVPMIGIAVNETISAAEYRFRGFISQFRILKNVVLYTAPFTPSTTLSVQNQTNAKSLVDPGNDLVLGNFIGSLDEVTLFDGLASNSVISYLNTDATIYTYPTPRDETVFVDQFKARNSTASQYWGLGKIWGTVTDADGTPLSRKVVLIEYWSYVAIEEQISDPVTGYYEFTNLDTNAIFSVIAEDHRDYRYNDIIRAKVQAEVV